MKVRLMVTKDRVKYIVEQFGTDRITVVKQDEPVDEIFNTLDDVIFEMNDPLDFLTMFHAGIKCGMEIPKESKSLIVDKKELHRLYMEWVNQVSEDCEWKTHFGPEEIVYSIGNIIEKNPQLLKNQ